MASPLELPKLNETMLEATIVRWLKQEGDAVARGEPVVEVETDKAITEVLAAAGGRLLKILAPVGSTVPAGGTFALVGAEGESVAETPQTTGPVPQVDAGLPRTERPARVPGMESKLPRRRVQISPVARRLAVQKGVDLDALVGTGPGGMIIERDVEQAVARPQTDLEEIEVVLLAGTRKIIAERMLESKQTTAQVTTFIDVDMTAVGKLRRDLGATYTAFVVKAAAQTLTEYPYLNASLEGDRILLRKKVHMGVAVAAGDALVVPVIRDAGAKSLRQIVEELADLSLKGRERRLTSEEMRGATFTITNPGVFGAVFSTPIINLPQSAILGTGRVRKVPVVRGDAIVVGEVMFLSLSYDHRVVDGAPAARFLRAVKELLENPDALLR